jgi:hypothetical protein
MKIKSIKTYQSVNFDRSVDTFFTIIPVPNKPHNITLTHMPEMNAISVQNANDHVIIPMTNVVAVYLWTERDTTHEEFKASEAKKAFGVKGEQIKRPK